MLDKIDAQVGDRVDAQVGATEATIPPSPDDGVIRRFAELDDEALTAEVARVGAQVAAGQARLVELAAEADRRVIWGNWEARSLAEWLSWLTGMAPRNSRDHALVADRLDDFPATHAALSQGVISFDQARAIASTEAPEHDHKLAELAQQTTAGQLRRVVRAYRKVTAVGATDDANAANERRYLNYFFDDRCFGRATASFARAPVIRLQRSRTSPDPRGTAPNSSGPTRSWPWPRPGSPSTRPRGEPTPMRSSSTSTPPRSDATLPEPAARSPGRARSHRRRPGG